MIFDKTKNINTLHSIHPKIKSTKTVFKYSITLSLHRNSCKKLTIKSQIMKNYYVLFQTDIYKTKSSRIFLGVFSSFQLANQFAKENNCYTYLTEVVILEIELEKFEEI